NAINALEPTISALSDDELRGKTAQFRQRLATGATLDQLLPEAFAVVRETTKRVLGTRHYDVQLMGGIALHQGKIPEMRTGEGKTQVALLPVYLNALTGQGVHVVTVNDYLAERDSEWMGRVYTFLGLTVGVILEQIPPEDRREAYACDITYATNNQLGFDYLRDNMVYRLDDMVQRPFHYAIIDEVDSILIDEARTPLIISGPSEDTTDMYLRVDALIPQLVDEKDIEQDEKTRSVLLTDDGVEHIEALAREAGLLESGGLYDTPNMNLVHHVTQALRAHKSYKRDKDYIVKDKKIIIIDEFTGRMMSGRRYGEGLHQALEAKEHVPVQRESQTLASITFQNFFRLYPKFGGMTGTALTEASEFAEIYNLDVISIPTHRPVQRIDENDEIYRTEAEKLVAIVALVKEAHARKQPVLVGTTSIEKSEQLSALFKREKIPHNVLNARHHEQEAYIVAQAGRPGAVMIATNMAGRGTDIKLGGNADLLLEGQLKGGETPEQIEEMRNRINAEVERDKPIVLEAGGLYIIGTERHESRRIDNQLRGRAGRQGDPGASKFFISLEDDLMRVFGAERIDPVLQRLGIKEGQSIYHPWINTAIERAQKKVEAQHFDSRRDVLRYDNVVNDQRKVIYEQRRQLMTTDSLSEMVREIIEDVTLGKVEARIPANSYKEKWDLDALQEDLEKLLNAPFNVQELATQDGIGEEELTDKILEIVAAHWAKKQSDFIDAIQAYPALYGLPEDSDPSFARDFATNLFADMEHNLVLRALDKSWKEHLLNLDHLRQGIRLRGYAQRDPVNEYKAEAFAMFNAMLDDFKDDISHVLLGYNVTTADDLRALQQPPAPEPMIETRLDPAMDPALADFMGSPEENNVIGFDGGRQSFSKGPVVKQVFDQSNPATWTDTQRNAPCPCGSGKKYKHCHGAMQNLG
ncbi:MAG: preprotein translocase subunit SecA, partial [Alphaproteobacteria bacterium]|nr:preprotein translocase subunit SecA [Alphaproteobacteria bacterium]